MFYKYYRNQKAVSNYTRLQNIKSFKTNYEWAYPTCVTVHECELLTLSIIQDYSKVHPGSKSTIYFTRDKIKVIIVIKDITKVNRIGRLSYRVGLLPSRCRLQLFNTQPKFFLDLCQPHTLIQLTLKVYTQSVLLLTSCQILH